MRRHRLTPPRRANLFKQITIKDYLQRHKSDLSPPALADLQRRLEGALRAKLDGELCECGETIWALGSAEVGLMCFTCMTGEAVPENDYEIIPPP